MAHDFDTSRRVASDPLVRAALLKLYGQLWPGSHVRHCDTDVALQLRGVDAVVRVGRVLHFVEEKIRPGPNVFDDFLCEVWSDYERRVPGWTVDVEKITDTLVYVIVPTRAVWILPFRELRDWCRAYWPGKLLISALNEGPNGSWITKNLPIAWPELLNGLKLSEPAVRRELPLDESDFDVPLDDDPTPVKSWKPPTPEEYADRIADTAVKADEINWGFSKR